VVTGATVAPHLRPLPGVSIPSFAELKQARRAILPPRAHRHTPRWAIRRAAQAVLVPAGQPSGYAVAGLSGLFGL